MKQRNNSDSARMTATIGLICLLSLCNLLMKKSEVPLVEAKTNLAFGNTLTECLVNVEAIPTKETLLSNIPTVEIPIEEEHFEITFDSHTFSTFAWKGKASDEITVRPDTLYDYYVNAPEMEFDYKNRSNTINCLWQFLVEENNIDPILAASVLGHISQEGDFGLKEGTQSTKLKSIHDARANLSDEECCGWGIIQWSFTDRRKPLLTFYEDANNKIPEDIEERWLKASISAECVFLLEELKTYNIVDGYYSVSGDSVDSLIESTVGYLSYNYIKYQDYPEQWSHSGNSYRLIDDDSNGSLRVQYAKDIYRYYME